MPANQHHAEEPPDNEIRSSRVISAPRELVWTALSSPTHLLRWWGPKGFTNTFHQFDFKVGGMWKFIMHGPDGTNYQNESSFVEITEPSRLVLDHISRPRFRMIITLENHGDKTEIIWRQIFETAAECAKVKVYAVPANEQNFDRLEEQLKMMSKVQNEFVISRVFDAPRDLVWKAWTEPDRLMKWFGPKGSTMPTCKMDFRPGGVFHFALRSPDGTTWHGKWVFREIKPPEKIVLVSSFSDEEGGTTRHPFSFKWPLETLSTTILAEQGVKTKLTLRWSPLNATAEEIKVFGESHPSMKQGWTGTFEQLEEFLATNKGK